jgi:outer membrane receptor protein involved in Fe transport
VPVRDASGAITGTDVLRDPGCGVANDIGPGGTDVGSKGNFLTGSPHTATEWALGLPPGIQEVLNPALNQECAFFFGEMWNYINPQEKMSAYVNFQYDFSENIANEFDVVVSRLTSDSRGSPQNPGGRTEEFPVVLGEHPGNPFRAMTADGTPLYAVDADGDGVPDRGTDDLNGDGVFDVIVAGTDPAAGIPFNEDVDVVALRILSKTGMVPGANQPTSLNDDGSNTGNASFDSWTFRARDTLRVRIPDTSWEIEATAIASRGHVVLEEKNTSQNALEAGLRGELVDVPESDPAFGGGPQYWNPFATQALECEDRVCAHTGTPGFANSVSVLDAINIQSHEVTDTEFWSADIIATGELFDLPAGRVLAAFGTEYRKEEWDVDISAQRNQCDWHEGGCGFDWKADQDVWSAFFEVAIPAHETLELTIAGRYSDYGGGIGDSFDPKFAALWQPLEILSFRASWGSAFIAPTLEQQFASEDCGLQTMEDELTGDFSGTFRVACVSGNPNLAPEEADTYNIGVSLSLLDGDLTLGVDYANYQFTDRISEETGNNVLRANFNSFLAAGNDPADPADVANWIANNETKIFRGPTGLVTRVLVDQVNAQEMEHAAWDFYGSYNLGLNNFGDFTFGLNATFADKYTYDLGTGDPRDSGDGVGNQNEQVSEIPPLPEWRVNGTVHWFLGNHAARVRVRWIDAFDLQFNSAGLQTLHGLRGGEDHVDAITYVDLNYKYTFDDLIGDGSTTVEVGANNVFDEYPDPFFNLGGIETFVHDVRGRMWYLRLNQTL